MRRFLRENGLGLASFGFFLMFFGGQILTGFLDYNQNQQDHGQQPIGFTAYFTTGHFVEATFENWESEFLQMGAYVLLTVWLRQKGSAESKQLEGDEEVDKDPREEADCPDAPWPVQQGGLILVLYEYSLTIALFALFVLSFLLHAAGGASDYSQDQLAHGGQAISMVHYMGTARFWFESFQNWQSEFLSVAAIVVLSIFLRQRGSPESKPVAHPHSATEE